MKSIPDKMELELLRIKVKDQKFKIKNQELEYKCSEERAEKLKERRDYYKTRSVEENFRVRMLFAFTARIMRGFFQNRTLNTANIKGLIKRFIEEDVFSQLNEANELWRSDIELSIDVKKAKKIKEEIFNLLSEKLGISLKEERRIGIDDTSQKDVKCGGAGIESFEKIFHKMSKDIKETKKQKDKQ